MSVFSEHALIQHVYQRLKKLVFVNLTSLIKGIPKNIVIFDIIVQFMSSVYICLLYTYIGFCYLGSSGLLHTTCSNKNVILYIAQYCSKLCQIDLHSYWPRTLSLIAECCVYVTGERQKRLSYVQRFSFILLCWVLLVS